jgi:hypothetical protein
VDVKSNFSLEAIYKTDGRHDNFEEQCFFFENLLSKNHLQFKYKWVENRKFCEEPINHQLAVDSRQTSSISRKGEKGKDLFSK